jgi:hypothetical protein
VNPQGEFAGIKVEPSFSLTKKMLRGDVKAAKPVAANPGNYNPPALAAAANALLASDPEQATYLFYLGQLRARSDANKSLDPSASAGIGIFNQKFGPRINQYAFKDISKLKATVRKVVADDKTIPRNYDPRWIALHGMDAFSKSKVRFKPQSQWGAINSKTRIDYYNGFKSAAGMH